MKASSRKSFYWQATLWLGAFLTLAGLGAGFVTGQWGSPIPLALLCVGALILATGIIIQAAQPQFWRQRSTQAGANALLSVIAVLLIFGVLNVVGVQKVTRFDLTENQRYSLSPQSKEVVSHLKTPAKLWIFDQAQSEGNRNLLENYKRFSNHQFSYELVDPREQPSLAQKFGVQSFGEVYLEVNNKPERLQTLESTGGQKQAPLSESSITNALARINSGTSDMVYFLQGHGEYALNEISQATNRLQERGFTSGELNIAQNLSQNQPGIPENASVVVLAGAQKALFPQEIDALKTYVDRGGNALLMVDPRTELGLDDFLKSWGVSLDPGMVIDGTGGVAQMDKATGGLVGFGPTAPLVNSYGSHPITQEFKNGNSFYPYARAIVLKQETGETQTPLFSTNSESWAEHNIKDQVKFDPGQDVKGPLVLGVALSRSVTSNTPNPAENKQGNAQKPADKPKKETRMVVIGNSSFMTNGLFNQQLNGDVFTNSIVWLSQREGEVLSISPKDPTNRRIQLKEIQARWVTLLSLMILPLAGFGLGGFLWWQRR